MVEVSRIFDDSRLIVKVEVTPVVILPSMRSSLATIALTVLLTACAGTTSETTTTEAVALEPIETTTSAAPTTTAPPADSPCLVGERPFSSSGVVSAFGGATGDAAQVSGLRAGTHPGCERVVVDLLTVDGAPAGSIGLVGVEYNETVGIVRINLPASITKTAVADSLFDGELVERAYVVRTEGGQLAIDIHVVAGAAVALRAFEVDAPSRVVVDVRPQEDAEPVRGATTASAIVIVDPAAGPTVSPLVVTGYARTVRQDVSGRIHETRDTDPINEQSSPIRGGNEVWHEFTISFPPLPEAQLELFVGTGSGNAGIWMPIDLTPRPDVDPSDT